MWIGATLESAVSRAVIDPAMEPAPEPDLGPLDSALILKSTDHSSKKSRLRQPGLLHGAGISAGAGTGMDPAPEPDLTVMEDNLIRIQKQGGKPT